MVDKRPILLATDGSPSASEAQLEALALAQALDVTLLVVAVAHATLPAVGYTSYGYSNVVAELTEAEHHRIETVLASVTDAAEAAEVRCFTFAADGLPVEEICRVAHDRDAQLIVVGSHGWGAARRLLSGSVSTGLVHAAPCPVLVIRGPRDAVAQTTAA
jgi:nucleotide-binding universal stress UspA family protein